MQALLRQRHIAFMITTCPGQVSMSKVRQGIVGVHPRVWWRPLLATPPVLLRVAAPRRGAQATPSKAISLDSRLLCANAPFTSTGAAADEVPGSRGAAGGGVVLKLIREIAGAATSYRAAAATQLGARPRICGRCVAQEMAFLTHRSSRFRRITLSRPARDWGASSQQAYHAVFADI